MFWSISMLSFACPKPTLQWWHNTPRIFPVVWQWSTLHPFTVFGVADLHIAHLLSCSSNIIKYCSGDRPWFLLRCFFRSNALTFSGLAANHAFERAAHSALCVRLYSSARARSWVILFKYHLRHDAFRRFLFSSSDSLDTEQFPPKLNRSVVPYGY